MTDTVANLRGVTSTAAKPSIRITAGGAPQQAMADLIRGAKLYTLWSRLAFNDIRQRFRLSLLGPIWLTLSLGIMIGAMGLVFSTLFHQNMSETLPYITTGIIFWSLLTSCLTEGTQVFISAESFIRNIPQPVSLHFYRMVTRNLFIWLFNMVIYLLVVTIFKVSLGWSTMLFLPGFALFLINVIWMALASAILSTRYRDIPQVISNAIQVVFYVTPIFWSPGGLSNRPAFIDLNPFNHLLAIVRIPLLGGSPQAQSWLFCIAMAIVGVSITLGLYSRAHARIAYWV